MSNCTSRGEGSSNRTDLIQKYVRLGNEENNGPNCMGSRKRAKGQTIVKKQGREFRAWEETLRCYGCDDDDEEEHHHDHDRDEDEDEHHHNDDEEEEEEEEHHDDEVGVESDEVHSPKRTKQVGSGKRGPMDIVISDVQQNTLTNMENQNDDEDASKVLQDQACSSIARWIYDAGIDFNAVNFDSFHEMINAIGECGPGLKAPTPHEVGFPLLKKEVEVVNEQMKDHKEGWKKHGCSIMSDGWKDTRERTMVNFLVNGPKGSMFVESVDASKYCKTGEKIFELLSSFVEKVGPENVVQVVTDNTSNAMKLAGKFLMVKYPNLFWTPCAAHCLDLILEDIFEIPRIKLVFAKAMKLNRYIYGRHGVVNLMRKFTLLELVRPAKTRFTTAFLTLARINVVKKDLRSMFESDAWRNSEWAKEVQGKQACKTVMDARFWRVAIEALKVAGPLFKVIRIVNCESKPAMGYIYEAMHKAKETIAKNFGDNEEGYIEYFRIIDARWEYQFYQPLHAAGYYLNPAFFYKNDGFERDNEVMKGLFKCLKRVVPDLDMQNKIKDEMITYKNADSVFQFEIAKRQRSTRPPVEWWTNFGAGAPNLRAFALKILSLTCIASGCEKNSNFFERIHSKKRNRLAQAKLNDLVFVKYNRELRRGYVHRDHIEPISLVDIDECNEWFVAEDDENDEEEHEPSISNGEDEDEDGFTFGFEDF